MHLIRELLRSLAVGLIAGGIIVLFGHIGEFTIPQSFLLGACFTTVGVWLFGLFRLSAFRSCGVEIFVNFQALCDGLGVLKGCCTSGFGCLFWRREWPAVIDNSGIDRREFL